MERETTSISTANHTFTVKTYATARERNIIQGAYFKGIKMEIVGEAPKISEFDPTVQYSTRLELIRQIVVSMDENSSNIVERCEDLHEDEFQDLVTQLDAIISKKKK
jgi:hypothetical protein